MLQFSRTQTILILATILVVCGLSAPNFASNETIATWPKWAQRRIMLAPELQGGSSVVVEVDQSHVREYVLDDVLHEARDILRNARIGLATPVAIHDGSVEVRPIASDYRAALAELEELSRAFNGVRAAEITDAGNRLIRVIPTEAHIQEYERPTTAQSIGRIRARLFGIPASVEREGPWRIRVQAPKLTLEALSQLRL